MWHLLRRNRDALAAVRSLLRNALGRDPSFATAHVAFCVSSFRRLTCGFASDAAATRAGLLSAAALARKRCGTALAPHCS
ncbi:MAG TPA: hypothetical protein VND19_14065 [Acetobacteraceae bacterium]|nr:hypothetical protein [Acetobacteraceae bacterium]